MLFGGSYYAINNEYGTLRVGLPASWSGCDRSRPPLTGGARPDRSGCYVDGIIVGGLFDARYITPGHGQTRGMNGTSIGALVESAFPFGLVMARRTSKVGRTPVEQVRFGWLNRTPRVPCMGSWY